MSDKEFEDWLIDEMGPMVLAGDTISMHDAMQRAFQAAQAIEREKAKGLVEALRKIIKSTEYTCDEQKYSDMVDIIENLGSSK